MKMGDRVEWTYKHHLNSKSSTNITKKGVLIRFGGVVSNIRYVSGKIAVVHFDGNKYPSKVFVSELKKIN